MRCPWLPYTILAGWVIATENIEPAKPTMLTTRPFTEKLANFWPSHGCFSQKVRSESGIKTALGGGEKEDISRSSNGSFQGIVRKQPCGGGCKDKEGHVTKSGRNWPSNASELSGRMEPEERWSALAVGPYLPVNGERPDQCCRWSGRWDVREVSTESSSKYLVMTWRCQVVAWWHSWFEVGIFFFLKEGIKKSEQDSKWRKGS